MSKENEKNATSITAHIIGIFAIILSIVLMLCITLPRINRGNLEFDYEGITVALLALAVTIFVAVQIYQSVTLLRDIDEKKQKAS